MQDPNIENTVPTPINHGLDETIPVPVNREIEQTLPTRVQPRDVGASQDVEAPREAPALRNEQAGTAPDPEATQRISLRGQSPDAGATQRISLRGQSPAEPPVVPPSFVAPPPPPPPIPPAKLKSGRRWLWILLGVVLVFALGGFGTWMGYNSAVQLRRAKQEEQRVSLATTHFMYGLQAQQNKQYEIAQKQFEYVIQLDPGFPGAADKLREAMMAQMIKATPTPQPTVAEPTATPTKDTRPQEEIYNSARQQYAAKQWDDLFNTIDSLRTVDPTFHAVEVDGMLYTALRFRGVEKIIYKANLEGGLYDLAMAEQFGPLDVDAQGYRNWARLYLNGASFWEVDWQKVVDYFAQIYPYIPNMTDGSGITAAERFRTAAREYGNKLVEKGDYCGALEYYNKSMEAIPDGALAQTATAVYNTCHPPETATPVPPSVTPTTGLPVATDTTTPETPTPETPTPTPEATLPTEVTEPPVTSP